MDCGRNRRGGRKSQEFQAFFKGTWIIKRIRTVLTQSTKSILHIKKSNVLFTIYFLLEEDEDLALKFFLQLHIYNLQAHVSYNVTPCFSLEQKYH